MTDLKETGSYWDRHAQRDPLWAILSDAQKRDGKWNVESFFKVGTTEIDFLLYELDSQQFSVRHGSALDFGCGVGRLTQALAPHFERVVGVDVSSSMVDVASRLNQHPRTASYVCNQKPDLRVFDDRSFDFIVTTHVLQHLPPDLACLYIHEFFRLLTPGGIAVFQLPSHRRRTSERPLESAANPMPDEAYRASLVTSGLASALPPGKRVDLPIEISNVSPVDWIQRKYGVFAVGNHWFEGGGTRMLTRDDGRTRLPATLRAGQTCRLTLAVTAPLQQGEYELEIDLVHEGVLWFHDRGCEPLRFTVEVAEGEPESSRPAGTSSRAVSTDPTDAATVRTSSVAAAAMDAADPGEFPMHGVPLNTIARIVAGHQGMLLHIDNDRGAGDDWVSYRYFVRAAV